MAKKVKREDLGLGINALFTNKKLDTGSEEELARELSHSVAEIPLPHIRLNPEQPRTDFDEEALDQLANSIKTFGLIQPITVRYLGPEEYQLISGERRLRATRRAGLERIPAYVRLANDKQEMLEMALVENIRREDLNAIEIAMAYQRLMEECRLTHEQLSERVGKRRTTVTNYLRLLEASAAVQQAIRERLITMGHARALLSVKDKSRQAQWLRRILEEGLSVRETERLTSKPDSGKSRSANDQPALSPEYRDVQQKLRAYFGSGKLEIKLKGRDKGQIVIPFQSARELNAMLDRLDD